jgi:hypothetical protein
VLIDQVGKVPRVWPLREPVLTPAFPEFHNAISDAIRQWEFEPLRVDEVAFPVCLVVTVNIHWE